MRGTTRYVRFARSYGPTRTTGSRRPSCAAMSSRTRTVAVAVNAWMEAPGKSCLRRPSRRYSGLKSCPHWLMQCASSIAMNRTPARATHSRKLLAAVAHQALGRDVQQAARAAAHHRHRRTALVRRLRAVQARCGHAARDEPVDLVLHQSDERRDDQREARARPCRRRPAPAPGSRATCPRRSAGPARCHDRRESRRSPRAARA